MHISQQLRTCMFVYKPLIGTEIDTVLLEGEAKFGRISRYFIDDKLAKCGRTIPVSCVITLANGDVLLFFWRNESRRPKKGLHRKTSGICSCFCFRFVYIYLVSLMEWISFRLLVSGETRLRVTVKTTFYPLLLFCSHKVCFFRENGALIHKYYLAHTNR